MNTTKRPTVGDVFGDWTVIEGSIMRGEGKKRKSYSCCRCVCGVEKIVLNGNLKSGVSAGCSCRKVAALADATRTHGAGSARESGSRAASVWIDMIKRCSNPNHANYPRYGGRGITVCARWLGDSGFKAFVIDMGEPPVGYSIGRIDNDGPYEPVNCRWETRKQQQSNMRSNVYGWLGGKKLTMEEIARRERVPPQTIRRRLDRGLYQS